MAANQAGQPKNALPENLELYALRQYFFTNIVDDNFLHDQSMYPECYRICWLSSTPIIPGLLF